MITYLGPENPGETSTFQPPAFCTTVTVPLISTQELISGFVCTGNQFYCNTGASRTAASGSGFGSQLLRYTILNV